MQTHIHNTLTGWKNPRCLMWYLTFWMSSMSSEFTYLLMEKLFPDHMYYTQVISVPLVKNLFIIDQPTTQPVHIFVLVILLTWYFHRADYFNTGLMSPPEHMFIIEGIIISIWQQYGSMIAVEHRGVHIYDGMCLFIYGACSTTLGDWC